MKSATKWVHKMVKSLHAEGFFIRIGRVIPFFRKFVPLPSDYPIVDRAICRRAGVTFEVNRSDYMQWVVYADEPDSSWDFAARHLKDHSVVLDIGSNFGAFSFKVAGAIKDQSRKQVKVQAIEPNPQVAASFRSNLKLNKQLVDLIELNEIAMGAEDGRVEIDFNPQNTGGGRVEQTDAGGTISMTTIDKLVSQNDWHVSFIKIDVEGFEPLVIRGANDTLKNQKPALYIEMTDRWFRKLDSSSRELVEYFDSLGYKMEVVRGRSLYEINPANLPHDDQYDLLLTPQPNE